MPGLGIGEVIVIILIALILFDPQDWPRIFYKIGRFWNELNRQKDLFLDQIRQLDIQSTSKNLHDATFHQNKETPQTPDFKERNSSQDSQDS